MSCHRGRYFYIPDLIFPRTPVDADIATTVVFLDSLFLPTSMTVVAFVVVVIVFLSDRVEPFNCGS